MKQLLAARCNLDLQTEDGYTPLFIAAATGLEAATQQLLAAGCNVGLREKGGRTALQIAQSEGHSGVATPIRNGGKRCTAAHTLPTPKPQSCHVDTAERKTEDKEQEKQLLGRLVVISGLLAKPELNGRTGTAMSYDDDKGRYCVKLDQTSTSLIIKPCNLRDNDLGVLLNKWGVTDARTALEGHGFNNLERIRDFLDVEDLSVLKLPLATHKPARKRIGRLGTRRHVGPSAHLTRPRRSLRKSERHDNPQGRRWKAPHESRYRCCKCEKHYFLSCNPPQQDDPVRRCGKCETCKIFY